MTLSPQIPSSEPNYVWEIATLYPPQGAWSEEEYLEFTQGVRRRIELTLGRLEFVPLPTEIHEALVQYLFLAIHRFISPENLGKVYANGIRVRVGAQKIRLPDVVFLHKDHFQARHNQVWDGADLVIEVVSDDPRDRDRDYHAKLVDYASARIAEYWIVDFEQRLVTVYRLAGGEYAVYGAHRPGGHASSALLPGFSIDVAALFAATDDVPE